MKKNIVLIIIIALMLVLCPLAAFAGGTSAEKGGKKAASDGEMTVSVMSADGGRVMNPGMKEYVIGCVAAEMSPLSHPEALTAQAAASRTYALRLIRRESSAGKKAEISADPGIDQGYLTEAERREKWGDDFEKYEQKIEEAVDAADGLIVAYNGEPALTVYHSISAGKTESAANIWGSDYPYLRGRESPGDRLSPDYISEKTVTAEEFSKAVKTLGIEPKGDESEWIGETENNENGYVSTLSVCGERLGGNDIRKALSLKSACFTVEYSDGDFVFTCRGNGHGAGMSQYGADYMARQGSTWREIIAYYYPGTEIIDQ